uniref:Putative secreted protein n=1 Tax=Ixodes ricinus TaxID=34613 RepID=A0A6B0ULC7_IXORI
MGPSWELGLRFRSGPLLLAGPLLLGRNRSSHTDGRGKQSLRADVGGAQRAILEQHHKDDHQKHSKKQDRLPAPHGQNNLMHAELSSGKHCTAHCRDPNVNVIIEDDGEALLCGER